VIGKWRQSRKEAIDGEKVQSMWQFGGPKLLAELNFGYSTYTYFFSLQYNDLIQISTK
jgi:hypothetical protein